MRSLAAIVMPLCRPTLSYQRLRTTQQFTDEELHDKMRRAVSNKHDLQVLESFLIFNRHDLSRHVDVLLTIW
jgi:hypothetical protein